MKRILVLACVFSISGLFFAGTLPAEPVTDDDKKSFRLNELGIGGGYAGGWLKYSKRHYDAYLLSLRFGYDVSRLVGLSGNSTSLQLSFDPFVNVVDANETGVAAGVTVFARYFLPVVKDFKLFGEIGSGPVYLSIFTEEQEDPNFSFLSQFGLGAQLKLSEQIAVSVAARKRHLSNAGLRDPNHGINTEGVFTGISFLY